MFRAFLSIAITFSDFFFNQLSQSVILCGQEFVVLHDEVLHFLAHAVKVVRDCHKMKEIRNLFLKNVMKAGMQKAK